MILIWERKQGDDFQIFVNGTLIVETHDSTYTSGSLGMGAAHYSEGGQASFSDLAVYQG